MAEKDDITTLAENLVDIVERDKTKLARGLFGDHPRGYKQLSEEKMLQLVSHRWGDPQFRQRLLLQIGDERFLEVGTKLGYYQRPPSMSKIIDTLKEVERDRPE